MANEEHLRILKRGIKSWNNWRKSEPETAPQLSQASLAGEELVEADLRDADLTRANLTGTRLTEAKLTNAHLNGAYLSMADLTRADLSGAGLIRATLRGTTLHGAQLNSADCSGADFKTANLRAASLNNAKLVEANLSEALLVGVNLCKADLRDASLNQAILGDTLLADVDLARAKGLDTVWHLTPSTVGIDTIYRSGGNISDVFLRGAGVPENFIQYMHSLVEKSLQYYSCFISYSHDDEPFCKRLYADLQTRGVRAWFFPEDATWGKTVWGEIDRSIRVYDKLVVVCSRHSLQSGPVIREIERALEREDKEGTTVLFPISLDDYIFHEWQYSRKEDVVAHVVVDFTRWDWSADSYQRGFSKLIQALTLSAATGSIREGLVR